jgi:flavin-dependent dehydrogenase
MPASPARTHFDATIVGAGPAGLFAACHLCEYSGLRVLMIEKGKPSLRGPAAKMVPLEAFEVERRGGRLVVRRFARDQG